MSARPNILQIITHDLGRYLPCYGWRAVEAPNLTRLAASGVVFEQNYAASICCIPARGCLMTGRYAHESGLVGLVNRGWDYRPNERTLAHELAEAGYRTLLFGLQHETSGDPRATGYAEVWGESTDAHAVAGQAEAFFKHEAAGAAPFYLNLGFVEVHRAWDKDAYEPADASAVEVPAYLPDAPEVREDLARFYGCIKYMDAAVGRILAALEASGLAESTLVVFTTDHGEAFPRAKGTLFDPGVGTALIARLPGGASDLRVDALTSHLDLAPTFLELAGAPVPERMHGASLLTALRGEAFAGHEAVFFEKNFHRTYDPVRAVRTKRHKLIRSFREGMPAVAVPRDVEEGPCGRNLRPDFITPRPAEELYDLESDPNEEKNLAGDASLADVKAKLTARLDAWMRETGDFLLTSEVPAPPRPGNQPMDLPEHQRPRKK